MQPIKRTPLDNVIQQSGATPVDEAGWHVAADFGDPAGEAAAARETVIIADQSARGKIMVEGETAGRLLGTPDLPINHGTFVGPAGIFRLRPDLFFLSTPPGAGSAHHTQLTAQAARLDSLITVTDVTHGRAELWLAGPHAAALLSRLCGLDFHPNSFPNLTAKQSSVAKTAQIVIRRDLDGRPVYALIGPRSFAAYLWQTILQAGRDLGTRPAGVQALAT